MRNVSGLYDRGTPLTLICTVTQGTSYHFSPIFFLSIWVFICLDDGDDEDQGQTNKSHISFGDAHFPSHFFVHLPPVLIVCLWLSKPSERAWNLHLFRTTEPEWMAGKHEPLPFTARAHNGPVTKAAIAAREIWTRQIQILRFFFSPLRKKKQNKEKSVSYCTAELALTFGETLTRKVVSSDQISAAIKLPYAIHRRRDRKRKKGKSFCILDVILATDLGPSGSGRIAAITIVIIVITTSKIGGRKEE